MLTVLFTVRRHFWIKLTK